MSFAATYCCRLCSAAVPTETTNRGGSFWSYPSGGGQSPYLLLEDSCRAGLPLHNETAYAARAIRLDGSKNDDIYIYIYRLVVKKI